MPSEASAYERIIAEIFHRHHRPGSDSFEFEREEIAEVAEALGIPRPRNLGDVVYTYRCRKPMPPAIASTASKGHEWVIPLAGRGLYRFKHRRTVKLEPQAELVATKIPDSTPEIVGKNSLDDEQALLANVRYNRLVDIFLGLTTYSLQNHLRTQVTGLGQIEIDELYVGVNRHGAQFVIPVQAKGRSERLTSLQTEQDMVCCAEKFPHLVCRPVSAQFMDDGVMALFELTVENDEVRIVEEKHYRLVPADAISEEELRRYRRG